MAEDRHSGTPGGDGGGANLLFETTSSTLDSSTGSFVDIDGLNSGNVTVAGTSSILLISATVPIKQETDRVAEYRFAIDGVLEGPHIHSFTDATNEGTGITLTWVKTGLAAGTHTFALQWKTLSGSATDTDVNRSRSLFVVELL